MGSRAFLVPLTLVVLAMALPNEGAAQQPRITTVRVRPPVAIATVFNPVVAPAAPAGTCAPATLAQCKTYAYLVSACGQANIKQCQTLMKPEYDAYYAGLPGTANRPVFPIGKPTLFGNLKNAKFHAVPIVKPVSKSAATFRSTRMSTLTQALVDPKTHVPNPAWENNGSMESCEEYTYEKYYDWSRFMDGVRLCRGDYNCIMDVAYVPSAPGIANRELKSKYGARLEQPRVELPKAKNIFFARGATVIGAPGTVQNPFKSSYNPPLTLDQLKAKFPQYAADFDELRQVLDNGAVFYDTKANPGVDEVYANPWDFHKTMRQRTKNVTENEWEELERRRTEVEQWLDISLAAPSRDIPVAVNKFMPPGSDVEILFGPDPFVRSNLFQNEALRSLKEGSLNKIGGAQTSGPQLRFSIPESAALGVFPAVAPNGVAPTTNYPNPNTTAVAFAITPQVSCPQPTVMSYNQGAQSGMSRSDVDKRNQKSVADHAACKVMNLTLAEWWRYKGAKAAGCNDRGSCGCLDLKSSACDWSIKMFWEAYAKALPEKTSYEREKDYKYCKRWAYMPWTSIPAASKQKPEELEKFLKAEQARIEGIARRIPQKRNPPNSVSWDGTFGQDFADEEVEGDEDSWSAGYKYDLGWAVKANTWTTVNNQKRPCSLEGQARAGFWVKMTTPIDGALPSSLSNIWRHAVDADAWVRANELDPTTKKPNGEVRYEAHLIIANEELFADPDEPSYKEYGYKPYNPNDKKTFKTIPLNYAYRPTEAMNTIPSPKLTVTVMAGPVPITGAAWVELFYGAAFEASAKFAKECKDNKYDLFEAKVGFIPIVGLDGAMSIGIGISGIASAGIKGQVNLITAGLPLRARTYLTPGANSMVDLGFDIGADLTLSTLSGRVSLYVEFFFVEEEFELFRWNGLGPETFPLLTIVAEKLPLFSLAALTP